MSKKSKGDYSGALAAAEAAASHDQGTPVAAYDSAIPDDDGFAPPDPAAAQAEIELSRAVAKQQTAAQANGAAAPKKARVIPAEERETMLYYMVRGIPFGVDEWETVIQLPRYKSAESWLMRQSVLMRRVYRTVEIVKCKRAHKCW